MTDVENIVGYRCLLFRFIQLCEGCGTLTHSGCLDCNKHRSYTPMCFTCAKLEHNPDNMTQKETELLDRLEITFFRKQKLSLIKKYAEDYAGGLTNAL